MSRDVCMWQGTFFLHEDSASGTACRIGPGLRSEHFCDWPPLPLHCALLVFLRFSSYTVCISQGALCPTGWKVGHEQVPFLVAQSTQGSQYSLPTFIYPMPPSCGPQVWPEDRPCLYFSVSHRPCGHNALSSCPSWLRQRQLLLWTPLQASAGHSAMAAFGLVLGRALSIHLGSAAAKVKVEGRRELEGTDTQGTARSSCLLAHPCAPGKPQGPVLGQWLPVCECPTLRGRGPGGNEQAPEEGAAPGEPWEPPTAGHRAVSGLAPGTCKSFLALHRLGESPPPLIVPGLPLFLCCIVPLSASYTLQRLHRKAWPSPRPLPRLQTGQVSSHTIGLGRPFPESGRRVLV